MRRILLAAFISPVLIAVGLLTHFQAWEKIPGWLGLPPLPQVITGTVVDAKTSQPVGGAVVQVQGYAKQTKSAADGTFSIQAADKSKPVTVTAWTGGYYVGYLKLDPKAADYKGAQGISIKLKPLYKSDNYKYPWFSFEGVKGSASCGLCHREYAEWQADAHSQAAQNPRFLSIYQGTNVQGQAGQLTVYGTKNQVQAPDPAKPYYGVGFKLDYPNRDGNCATCHTPVAGKISNQKNCGWSGCHTSMTSENSKGVVDPSVSPLYLDGDAAEGITCDFCHKVGEVIIDPQTRLPYADMPGILSMQLSRPAEGEQLFYGNFGDVARRVAVAPVESKSEFCAPCHYGVFGGVVGNNKVTGGVVIYNSYGEWLNSPYSDPKTGKTCQDCHMPKLDTTISVFPEKGGIPRDYVPLHEHQMPGASDKLLLQNAVTMKSTARRAGDKLQVEINILNDNTGHDIPTDAPLRQMILVVEALDAAGKPLAQSQGPVLPDYAGNYAKQAGKVFSKLLRDEWTGETPTAAYWRPVTIVEDTRLAAMQTDITRYAFDLPAGQVAKVHVSLVFRRAPQQLMQEKGWTDPDIVMKEETIQVER